MDPAQWPPVVSRGSERAKQRPPPPAASSPTDLEQLLGFSAPKPFQRQYSPSSFRLGGNDRANYSTHGRAFEAIPFGHSCTPSAPSVMTLSRSISPAKSSRLAKSANAALADTLPAAELEMVKELGINAALCAIACKSGFKADAVRAVYLETGSLRQTDKMLREMREGASDRPSQALSELMSDNEDRNEEAEQGAPAGGELEGKRELTQPSEWLQGGVSFGMAGEAPLAEVSYIGASHAQMHDKPKGQHRLRSAVDGRGSRAISQYTPPEGSRAARHLKQEREGTGPPRV